MLGVGMQEMMIIAVAALLIFGPGKLPEVMGQAGKMYRDFRNMTAELTGEFEKTVAEAKEMGNQITGELGPMQQQLNSVTKSVERDLGGKGKKTTTSSKSSTGSKGASSSPAKRSSSTSRSTKSTSSKSASTSRTSSGTTSSAAKSTTSSTAAKKVTAPIATKDDPDSDVSMFVPEPPKRERRARRATPSVITDLTPRDIGLSEDAAPSDTMLPPVSPVDDALARARARRRNAGYARPTA